MSKLAEPTSVANIPLPLELRRVARTRLVYYEPQHPGLGVSASYVCGYYQITLYVYDKCKRNLPDDPMAPVVLEELETSVREALAAAAAKSQDFEFRGVSIGTVGPDERLRFHVAAFGRTNDVGRYFSFMFLAVAQAKFVKLRISFVEPSQGAEGLASTIARQYFELLWLGVTPPALPDPKQPQVTQSIRGKANELAAYSSALDDALALTVDTALGVGLPQAQVKLGALYAPEALATLAAASIAGLSENLPPSDAAALFQVSVALAFERNTGALAAAFSTEKRARLAEHRRIVAMLESNNHSFVHGPALQRFMSRFTELTSKRQ